MKSNTLTQYNNASAVAHENISKREQGLVQQWLERDIFRRGIQREGGKPFVTYDGPPFATGNPHYGHVLAMSIKDAICTNMAQQGFDVKTKFGWDCHGVPIEVLAQKALETSVDLTTFNNKCRELIFSCVEEWEKQTRRLGRFINMGREQDYRTMDISYMSSVWGVFSRLNDKGLIYKDAKVVAYSPALGTVLSDFEAGLNYQKIQSPAITLAFPLQSDPNINFLVWTTTPWSVPANVAIAVNPKHQYVKVSTGEKHYILLKSQMKTCFPDPKGVTTQDINIHDYLGQRYQPLFDCLPNTVNEEQRLACYQVVASDHVTDSDGTGCVHICPSYGVDDYAVGKKYQLPMVDFIDANGYFQEIYLRNSTASLGIAGKFFKKIYGEVTTRNDNEIGDMLLLQKMKDSGRLFKKATVSHEYPMCWRTNTPLMYRTIDSIFVKVTEIKDTLIENNKAVQWHPENIGSHRFANWLSSARDWAISRTRSWGCPIPMWINIADPNDYLIISSQQELETLTGQTFTDLHRDNLDEVLIHKDGKTYQRTVEVFDCWFESGSMPYAQHGLTFTGDEEAFLQQKFPADFIAEGLDQTRGWFYALSVIGTALFGHIPFKHVVVNGILLGSDGKKMSKSEGNYPPIDTSFITHGADAMRLFLLGSPAVQAQSVAISEEGMKLSNKQVVLPILNIFEFLANSAKQHRIKPADLLNQEQLDKDLQAGAVNPFEAWLIYRTEQFKRLVSNSFEQYDLIKATASIKDYVRELSQWYVRMSRTRANANNPFLFKALHYALDTFCRYSAPITPFVAESIFQGLYGDDQSVHLETRPALMDVAHLKDAFNTVEQVRQIFALSCVLREKHNLRQRQPIQTIFLDERLQKALQSYEPVLKDLINCLEIQWVAPNESTLFSTTLTLSKGLGAKWKGRLKDIKEDVEQNRYQLTANGDLLLACGITLSAADNEFFKVIASKQATLACELQGELWLVIDTHITDALKQLGCARDLQRAISKLRKELGYQVSDTMEIKIYSDYQVLTALCDLALRQKGNRIILIDELVDEIEGFSRHIIEVGDKEKTGIALYVRKTEFLKVQPSQLSMFAPSVLADLSNVNANLGIG